MHHTRTLLSSPLSLSFLALCLLGSVPAAHASYTISIQEVGPDVVATGSGGSFDLTGLTFSTTTGSFTGFVNGSHASASVGSSALVDLYSGLAGPPAFGGGISPRFASSTSGAYVGFTGGDTLYVPAGYSSGAALGISTDTFSNTTIPELELSPGTYLYTWGTAPHADSFTVQIGPVVPEPASLGLLVLAAVGSYRRRR